MGVELFIGMAGLAAHLPGAIAAYTHRPVIGVPVDGSVGGIDALYATAQLPYPAPVATVGINRGDNAAILAAQIIAVNNSEVANKVDDLRKSFRQRVKTDDAKLTSEFDGKYFQKDFLSNYDDLAEEEMAKKTPNTDETCNCNSELGDETPLVSVILGSYSDIEVGKKVGTSLKELGISYDLCVISPIRYPEKFKNYISKMKETKLFIGVSGMSAHVTGSITALSSKPVIGVPVDIKLSGLDSLLSMANMPPGVPVGTVAIENGKNAGILAAEILGISNKEIENNLKIIKYKNSDL
jgi:5-(carboxyamino)imidazole ribonucleotide mutase